jgi:hypothetical protein
MRFSAVPIHADFGLRNAVARSVRHRARRFEDDNNAIEQSYQSDTATAFGRPVDDLSRRVLLLL